MSGNDLNFDELDQAVTSYMQKPPAPAPGTPAAPAPTPPVSAPAEPAPSPLPGTSPAPAAPPAPATPPAPKESTTTAAPTGDPKPAVTPAANSRLQVQTRQSLASTRARGGTFHDIMPAHRRSTVAPTKELKPLHDITPAPAPTPAAPVTTPPPVKPPLPEETKAAPTPPVPSEPAAPAPEEPTPESIDQPKILTEEVSDAIPPAAPETPAKEEPAPPADLATPSLPEVESTPKKEEKKPEAPSTDTLGLDGSKVMSDALLDDLRKEGEKATATEPASTPAAPKKIGLLAETPIELEDAKTPEESEPPTAKQAPEKSKSGLMDTGEIHNTGAPASTPVDPTHMLDAGSDDDQKPMQVFDTKEYHTPIAAGHEAPRAKSRKWDIVIIVLVVVIVVAAGFVAYMMAFGGNS